MRHAVGREQTDRAASLEAYAQLFSLEQCLTSSSNEDGAEIDFQWRLGIDVLYEANAWNVIFKSGSIVIDRDVLVCHAYNAYNCTIH